MNNFKIILMICNWGPYTAFQTLQDKGAPIPAEIKMIRIPCTGRVSKSLLFKAFEMGADGVALAGCAPGTCRHGTGTDAASQNTDDTREILDLLGLGKNRMRLATFLPDDSELLLQFLKDFCRDIKLLGKSPVIPREKTKPEIADKQILADIISSHDVYACQDCGKCSSTCPLALSGKEFSPRALAGSIMAGDLDSSYIKEDMWSCLTCGLCYERCPSAVNFPEFIKDLRQFFKKTGMDSREAHGGFFQSLMRTMTFPELKTDRWAWLPDNIQIDNKSKVLFFGGCAPFFDTFFKNHLGVQTSDIIVDSIRLLNFFDIKPALLENERCCGHDLLWSGDLENFLKLARLNVDLIHSLDIKEVITACPECYRTLKHDYAQYGFELKFKVTHLYDFLEKKIDEGAVGFKKVNKKLTFQDPCRLSRFEKRADLPRMLIKNLKTDGFQEMRDSGISSICCGNNAWVGCDSFSKALQTKRLRQARDTGSNLLVTACPKCQIHLKCAMKDPFLGDELCMEMIDLTSLIAKTIYRK